MSPHKSRGGNTGSVDEWFTKHEEELLRQARRERERKKQAADAERARLAREKHWMMCPKCGQPLEEQRISTVTVDRCTGCQGIFLDRGELEEILLQSAPDRRGFFRRVLGLGGD